METVISYLEWCAEVIRRNAALLFVCPHMTEAQALAFDHAAEALLGNAEAWATRVAPSHRRVVLERLGEWDGQLVAVGNMRESQRFEDAVIALMGMGVAP